MKYKSFPQSYLCLLAMYDIVVQSFYSSHQAT